MLIDHTDYLWKREKLEGIALTGSPFIYAPEKPMRAYKFYSSDYTGEVSIFDSESAEAPFYHGALPYIPQQPISFNSLVFMIPAQAHSTASASAITATIDMVAEVGTLKAVLEPYMNTTDGMDYVHNGYNDDSTYSTTGFSAFKFNGSAVNTIYISSNHWLGFGSSSEQLKVCRRDGCSVAIYRQMISPTNGLQILKIRFDGYTSYSDRTERNHLIFEVFLISNNDIFLNVIKTPTSGNTGESSFICNGVTTTLNLNIGSPDGAMVCFYHLDEEGKQWDIRYEMYKQIDASTRLYLVKLGQTFYTTEAEVLAPLDITQLNALTFMEYGCDQPPSKDLLTPLANPQIYSWESGDDSVPIKAVLKAYPYAQMLDTVADMSHMTILGIKLLTAEYSGNVGVQYSVDDGRSYNTETPLLDFLNIAPQTLWESLPKSRQLYLKFILHDNATLSRFKITYEN